MAVKSIYASVWRARKSFPNVIKDEVSRPLICRTGMPVLADPQYQIKNPNLSAGVSDLVPVAGLEPARF